MLLSFRSILPALFVLSLVGVPVGARAATAGTTRYFPYADERYLYQHQRQSGAALLPQGPAKEPVPLVVLLHGLNPSHELHLWLGGGGHDLRPLATELMRHEEIGPFVFAAPSQTKGGGATRSLWTGFELGTFVDAVAAATADSLEIDRTRVILVGHSGAGCNPEGGLASHFDDAAQPLPRALVSIDPCLDAEMGAAMAKRPADVPLLVWWQSSIWPRSPVDFWTALTLDESGPRVDRMLTLEVQATNPHDAILPLAFEVAVRELLAIERAAD